MSRSNYPTRRQTLSAVGAALATTIGLAGCLGQEGGGSEGTTADGQQTSTDSEQQIKLGGKTAGWVGQAPTRIEGKTNPPLGLTPGTTYTLVWENLDGTKHELIIEDANGKELVATEHAAEKGATKRVTFEATTKMAQYYCEYHPKSMRGDVSGGDEATGTPSTTTTSDSAY